MMTSTNAPRGGWRFLTSWLIIVTSMLGAVQFFFVDLPQAQAGTENGYAGLPYNSTTSDPTGEKPESKLWYADGRWWGSLQHAATGTYHIYWLDPSQQKWIDTGTVLDTRANSRADTLWDGNKLYVASHVFTTEAGSSTSGNGRLWRFSYTPATRTYTLDSGFPVNINAARTETLVIDKDSTGQLWATYTQGGKVYVNHSIGADTSAWGTPFVLNLPGATNLKADDDISSLVAFEGKIGVMWSNQNTDTFYFAVHGDNDVDTAWTSAVVYSYSNAADDHISLKSLQSDAAGNVFAAVKTSLDGNESEAQLVVLARRADGSWRSAVASTGQDNLTRPILMIDTSQRKLYIFMTTENGGAVYYKESGLDALYFPPTGLGTRFIGGTIGTATYNSVNNATSTKQNVNSSTGIVVLASDDSKRMYLHNYLGNLTPPPVTETPTTIPVTATPTTPPTETPTVLPTINPKTAKRVYIPAIRK